MLPDDVLPPSGNESAASAESARAASDPPAESTTGAAPPPALEAEPDEFKPGGEAFEPPPRRLAYLAAFRYAFSGSDWLISMVLLVIVGFLPVLGHVAQWGFFYEIVEGLYRRPDAPYARFDFRRFGDYCMRGVWPYVLSMTVWMILYMVFYLPMQLGLQFGLMFLLAANQQLAVVIAAIVISVILIVALLVIVGTAVLTMPMLLRAGLTQDFRAVFRLDWIKGYLQRMWVEETVATLFLMASAAALLPLGCLFFCVGALLVPVIVMIAASHLQWQIYEIYLERGGEPIPLQPLPVEAPLVEAFAPTFAAGQRPGENGADSGGW